jgi:hypothetical protein
MAWQANSAGVQLAPGDPSGSNEDRTAPALTRQMSRCQVTNPDPPLSRVRRLTAWPLPSGPARFTLTDRLLDLRTATVRRLNPGLSDEQPQKSQAHQPVRLVSQANFGCVAIVACAGVAATDRGGPGDGRPKRRPIHRLAPGQRVHTGVGAGDGLSQSAGFGARTCRAARRSAPVECAPPLPRPHPLVVIDTRSGRRPVRGLWSVTCQRPARQQVEHDPHAALAHHEPWRPAWVSVWRRAPRCAPQRDTSANGQGALRATGYGHHEAVRWSDRAWCD